MTAAEFRNFVKPNWCPGCGHFAILNALQQAAGRQGLRPEELAVVSGIGCSGRLSGYMYAYGVHAIHGRALPMAQGIKMGNSALTVVACGGDGDGFAIGMGHTIHAIRRNLDITYIVMDNHVYGLTKGQTSPRSDSGFKTKTTPAGGVEPPLPALELALASGASFVAQGFSLNINELTGLIEKAISHRGFSLVNVFSPCVTFNRVNTYEWYSSRLKAVQDIEDYDAGSRAAAMAQVIEYQGLLTGVIYQDNSRPHYQQAIGCTKPLTEAGRLSEAEFQRLAAEFQV